MTAADRASYAAMLAEHNRLTCQRDWHDQPRYHELAKEMAALLRTEQDEAQAYEMQRLKYLEVNQ